MKRLAFLLILAASAEARRPTIEQSASVAAAGLSMVASGKQVMKGVKVFHRHVTKPVGNVAKKAVGK